MGNELSQHSIRHSPFSCISPFFAQLSSMMLQVLIMSRARLWTKCRRNCKKQWKIKNGIYFVQNSSCFQHLQTERIHWVLFGLRWGLINTVAQHRITRMFVKYLNLYMLILSITIPCHCLGNWYMHGQYLCAWPWNTSCNGNTSIHLLPANSDLDVVK